MNVVTEEFLIQKKQWPKEGRHILAQFDEKSIVVYQAYRPSIGKFAAANQHFGGGGFSLNRMSWIKPNFLWMMYRAGWGTKVGQEVILAVRIWREAFDKILEEAVHSSYVSEVYQDQSTWKEAVSRSLVRLQWDPDHGPSGNKVERRAIQLGLRGSFLENYSKEWIISIEDISEFVAKQRQYVKSDYQSLLTPKERVYPVQTKSVAEKLGISS